LQEGGGLIDPEGLDRSSNSPLIRLAANPPVIDWRTCPPAPLAWIPLREAAATLLYRLQGRM
jgi:hypothetical protein